MRAVCLASGSGAEQSRRARMPRERCKPPCSLVCETHPSHHTIFTLTLSHTHSIRTHTVDEVITLQPHAT